MPHVVLPVTLPLPTMGTLDAIDHIVQQCVASNGAARESLVSHIHETVGYPYFLANNVEISLQAGGRLRRVRANGGYRWLASSLLNHENSQ